MISISTEDRKELAAVMKNPAMQRALAWVAERAEEKNQLTRVDLTQGLTVVAGQAGEVRGMYLALELLTELTGETNDD